MKGKKESASAADALIQKFIKPPRRKNPTLLLQHWIDVANHPEQFSPTDVMRRRAQALRNIRRLAGKHPTIAEQLMQTEPASKGAA
jgi:hypothetical protein